ncbi:hypothetical protein ACRAKJ_19805 [Saccharothrix sp. DSM 118769]
MSVARAFIATGPPRWCFTLAVALWLGGFLSVPAPLFDAHTRLSGAVADYLRVDSSAPARLVVPESGVRLLWVERRIGAEASYLVDTALEGLHALRDTGVVVAIDPPVTLNPHPARLERASRTYLRSDEHGRWSAATILAAEIPAGEYTVSTPLGGATRLAVGPDVEPVTAGWGRLLLSLAGAVLWIVTYRGRERARRRFEEPSRWTTG